MKRAVILLMASFAFPAAARDEAFCRGIEDVALRLQNGLGGIPAQVRMDGTLIPVELIPGVSQPSAYRVGSDVVYGGVFWVGANARGAAMQVAEKHDEAVAAVMGCSIDTRPLTQEHSVSHKTMVFRRLRLTIEVTRDGGGTASGSQFVTLTMRVPQEGPVPLARPARPPTPVR